MKKVFTILLLVILLIFTSSCVSPRRVVGDEYIVESVKKLYSHYETLYYIEASPVNEEADAFTFNGNKMKYYTNTFYSVGDTIKLYNSSK